MQPNWVLAMQTFTLTKTSLKSKRRGASFFSRLTVRGVVATLAALMVLWVPQGVVAQQKTSSVYKGKLSEKTAKQIEAILKEAVFPSTKTLYYVMTTLPKVKGVERLPIKITLDLSKDKAVALTCPREFGPVCEAFFKACTDTGWVRNGRSCDPPATCPPSGECPPD